MTGLVGSVLVTGACLWLGWSRCRWYGERERTLSQLCCDLHRMEAELEERETDTEALLALLASETGCTARLYQCCLTGLQAGGERSLSQLWSQALEECNLPLRRAELSLLNRAGQILGRYTGREQAALLAGLRRELDEVHREAREEGRQQGRTAVVLGLTLGLTLALVLA
ncbi:MAG: stage III sporulation protein AB [Candidatus Onthomonas sp.]